MKYPLAKDGVFWTLQGEGALQGEPMIFVRLAGCSVGCADCDTDYGVHRRVNICDLVEEIRSVQPEGRERPWVWITGGEPSDHNLIPLVDDLRGRYRFRVAIATSGVRSVPMADWISVSPHSSKFEQRQGHELKVVPRLNGLTWDDVATIDREQHSFPWRFIQPMEYRTPNGPEQDGVENRQALQECIGFVLTHPGWRLTAQAHKTWGLK